MVGRSDAGLALLAGNTEPLRNCCSIDATAHLELAEDVGDVNACRLLGDEQLLADLSVGLALRDKSQYLRFAGREAETIDRVVVEHDDLRYIDAEARAL